MKQYRLLLIVFFMVGVYTVSAQDLIVLRDGNIIEAKIIEISPSEIRYKRFDNLEGPTVVIYKIDVHTVKYENGTYEIMNLEASAEKSTIQTKDTDKLIIGINANPGGLLYSGPGIGIELTHGHFNSEISFLYPVGLGIESKPGFGFDILFNYIWTGRIMNFYLGGGWGIIYRKDYFVWTESDGSTGKDISTLVTYGLNIGIKFLLSSGLTFRAGANLGAGVEMSDNPKTRVDGFKRTTFSMKPDLSIGYSFK